MSKKKRARVTAGPPPSGATEQSAASWQNLPPECLALPDDQLAFAFWRGWIAFQARLREIPDDQLTPEVCENIRAASVAIDGDIEEVAGLEKALRIFAAGGDPVRVGSLIRQYITRLGVLQASLDEAVTGRRRQRAYAQKQRSDGLQRFILDRLREDAELTRAKLARQLKAIEGQGFIDTVDEERQLIEWHDEKEPAGTVSFNALGSRISRARKKS